MVKNAWNFILPLLAMAGAFTLQGSLRGGSAVWAAAAALCVTLALFCAWFFRDPLRRIPTDAGLVISPADGKVIAIEEVEDPYVGKAVEVRIFLNVFNVHVQRSPFTVAAKVEGTRYFAGKFLAASVPKASLENEQHHFRMQAKGGRKVVVKQIAGLIARRILPWAATGDLVPAGALIGLIQFGSQVDLVLPRNSKVLVRLGDKVVGGETGIARWAARRG